MAQTDLEEKFYSQIKLFPKTCSFPRSGKDSKGIHPGFAPNLISFVNGNEQIFLWVFSGFRSFQRFKLELLIQIVLGLVFPVFLHLSTQEQRGFGSFSSPTAPGSAGKHPRVLKCHGFKGKLPLKGEH